jgi:hypothetical protein
MTATVPRILATILNGTIVAGMVVLLHRCRTARLVPCRALTHFAREGYFLAPVYDRFTEGFCDCGHADRASPARLAPAASSVTLICWRRPWADQLLCQGWPQPNGHRRCLPMTGNVCLGSERSFAHQMLWNVEVRFGLNSGHSCRRFFGPLCGMNGWSLARSPYHSDRYVR